MTVTLDWRKFSDSCVRRSPCSVCGVLSPWMPKGWYFRYQGLRGGKRQKDAKVTTVRLCPTCAEAQNIQIETNGR